MNIKSSPIKVKAVSFNFGANVKPKKPPAKQGKRQGKDGRVYGS